MFKKLAKIGLATFSLMFGVLIVSVSLVATNRVESKDETSFSSRRLYLGREILPDNVLYPLVMVSDRAHLMMSSEQQRVNIQLLYAHRRMEYVTSLLDKGETALALSTLTKAQKYLLNAANLTIKQNWSQNKRVYVYDQLMTQHNFLERIVKEHPELSSDEVDRLQMEIASMAEQLN